MVENEELEDLSMTIIAYAGSARSNAFEAMSLANKKDFEGAREKLQAAREDSDKSHDAHSELLRKNAKGEITRPDLLLSHAQDHLMCAALAMELIEEIVRLRRELEEK